MFQPGFACRAEFSHVLTGLRRSLCGMALL